MSTSIRKPHLGGGGQCAQTLVDLAQQRLELLRCPHQVFTDPLIQSKVQTQPQRCAFA